MTPRGDLHLILTTATALGLCSCAVKDGRLDFTWWQDAAAPVMEDDVIIEAGGSGYYRSTPAPAKVPDASIPKEESTPSGEEAQTVVSQHQPAAEPPPAPTDRRSGAPAPAPRPAVHIVQPGDTLSALARRYGTSVNALVAANGMPDANTPLRINQQLKLPAASPAAAEKPVRAQAPAPAAPRTKATNGSYTVKAGDTIYGISRQHGVPPAALMQANGLTPETANTIRVGTILRIPAAQ